MFLKLWKPCYKGAIFEKDKEKSGLECFICFDVNTCNSEILKLNNQRYYSKKCKCNGLIHKKCLDYWYEKTQKCPICRYYITPNVPLIIKIKIHALNSIKYIFMCFDSAIIIARFVLFVLIIYIYFFAIQIYLYIILKKSIHYDYDVYESNNFNDKLVSLYLLDKNMNFITPLNGSL